MIRVAWNLLWLRPGVVGGSEEYATRQLLALAEHAADDVHVTAFVLAPFMHAYPELVRTVDCVPVGLDGRNKPRRIATEATWLVARTRRGFDLVHHVGGRVPLVAPGRRVLTIHDLQPLEQPQNFSPVKRWFLTRALPRSAARAHAIITPSEHVRARVIDCFSVDPARVHAIAAPVTIPAPDTLPRHVDESAVPTDLRPMLAGTVPFFLYPAITYAHKNHGVLLDAFAIIRRAHPEVRLVLSGGAGAVDRAVAERVARPDLVGAVVRPGRVERPILDALLARAVALTFPSRFEGFGLPVLEAFAARCPVIASDAAALREVVGDAGVVVDPDDVGGWATALAGALTDVGFRTARADAGVRVALRYAPMATAAGLVSVYRGVVSGW